MVQIMHQLVLGVIKDIKGGDEMKKKMTLTEATVRALQKEDKATNSELLKNTKSYRNTLEYLDELADIIRLW